MSLFSIMTVAGTALEAQTIRLNAISSNLANANVIAGRPEDVYRARQPVFSSMLSEMGDAGDDVAMGVRVLGMVESAAAPQQEFNPSHPMADADGYIYRSNVNSVDEMANMISASRSYQSSIEAMNTAKQLILRTLTLGR